jgi:carbonic anhydrase
MKTRKPVLLRIVAALAIAGSSLLAFAVDSDASLSADDALAQLVRGNQFYASGSLGNLVANSRPKIRQRLAAGQQPYAIVLGCSDSRVPPEIVFDKGLGEVFPIRVAGNVLAPHETGSIQYALEHLGSRLIVVLGHEKCGAVTAAVTCANNPVCADDPIAFYEPSSIGSIVDDILPSVQGADVEASVVENVRRMVEALDADPVVEELRAQGEIIEVIGAKYDLDTGIVTVLP